MRTKRIKLYKFSELSTQAQKVVLYRYRANYNQPLWEFKDFMNHTNCQQEPEFLQDGTLYNETK